MKNPYIRVAIKMDDGTTAVMAFFTKGSSPTLPYGATWSLKEPGIWERLATDANIFAEITKALPSVNRAGVLQPQPISYKVVDDTSVPVDRTYRNALRYDSVLGFFHDIVHARNIHRNKLRSRRGIKLVELDGAWMKAFATGNRTVADAIEAERQVLRDLPADPAIDAATTIEALKATWPASLPR